MEDAGEVDRAVVVYRSNLEQDPNDQVSGTHLALAEIARGNSPGAENDLRLIEARALRAGNAVLVPQIAYGYARLGLHYDANRLLTWYEEFSAAQRVPAVNRVMMSLARGNEASALEWLKVVAEKAPYEGYAQVFRIKANVFHDPILDKPAFIALREQLGFTDL